MDFEKAMGDSLCLPLPASPPCELTIDPKPKLFDQSIESDCGFNLKIYVPGAYQAKVTCGDTEASHVIHVETPQVAKGELQKLPPMIELQPSWGLWSAYLVLILLLCAGLVWGGRKLWKRFIRPKAFGNAHAKETWNPDPYLARLRDIDLGLNDMKLSLKEAAFLFTRLLYDAWKEVPYKEYQAKFYCGYEESCVQLLNIKFNPDDHSSIENLRKLLTRYGQDFQKAANEKMVGDVMRFEEPIWIGISVALACIAFAIHLLWLRRRRFMQLEVSRVVFKRHQSLFFGLHFPILFVLAGIITLGLALSKPYKAGGPVQDIKQGVDLMVLLDVSNSMLAEDFKPNRLEAAKETISSFTQNLINDRVGMVVYAGEAYVQFPLSFDHGLLKHFLPFIRTGQLKGGTAIGVALAYGVDRLKVSAQKSRAIILLTDGDNNAGNISPEQAAQMAKAEGIPIYALGIGQEGQVPYPVEVRDFFGRTKKQYQMVNSMINHELLKDLAKTTNGKYFYVAERDTLPKVLSLIKKMEKAKLPSLKPQYRREYMDIPFLWATLLLFLLGMWVEKRWVRAVP